MPLEKIEFVKEPIVGKRYLVPCVQAMRGGLVGDYQKDDWIPVIGHLHNDKKNGFDADHYHYDLRFSKNDRHGPVLNIQEGGFRHSSFMVSLGIQHKARKMVRETPLFPNARHIPILELAHKDDIAQSVKGIRRCPHAGFPLNAATKLLCGKMVCAGHGLLWDKEGNLHEREAV
jgi:hypothetical protein